MFHKCQIQNIKLVYSQIVKTLCKIMDPYTLRKTGHQVKNLQIQLLTKFKNQGMLTFIDQFKYQGARKNNHNKDLKKK